MSFADNLKNIRLKKNLSQQELADKLDLAQPTIGMWESGRRTPKIAELKRVAKTLDIEMVRLISEKGERKVAIEKNEIYIDGKKIKNINPSDIKRIVDYINKVNTQQGKHVQTPFFKKGLTGKKVLVIDDDEEICNRLYSFLVPHNYKVFLAFSGQMGLEYFQKIKPDIVLLDLKMSDIGGLEVLKIIRKTSKTPVLIITGHPQEISDIHLADLKIEGYIEKPISIKSVLNTLKYIIGE